MKNENEQNLNLVLRLQQVVHSGSHSVQATVAWHVVAWHAQLTSRMETCKPLYLQSFSSSSSLSDRGTWWFYWPFVQGFCPSLGGARTQHRISPPSPSSQGRPCVLVHKMDFILSHHLCTGVWEGVAKIINRMVLLKIVPIERTRTK